MKKILIIIMFLIGAVIFGQQVAIPGTPASVIIRGQIPEILELRLDFPSVVTLDLENESYKELGNVYLVSNLLGSCVINISSNNGGKLLGEAGSNSDEIEYIFNFGNNSVNLADDDFVLIHTGKTSKVGEEYLVSINYSSLDSLSGLLSADYYSDTLIFSISAQ